MRTMDNSDNIIKCGIIDDEKSARVLLEKLLNNIEGLKVVFSENRVEKAWEKIANTNPEILFVDIEMPIFNGFDLLNKVKQTYPDIVFVFVTAYKHYAIKAIKREVFDYLLKPVDLDELKGTITRFKNNKEKKKKLPVIEDDPRFTSLSPREKEILQLILKGLTSKEISNRLFISKKTVDTHRHNILDKLGYKSMKELIINNR